MCRRRPTPLPEVSSTLPAQRHQPEGGLHAHRCTCGPVEHPHRQFEQALRRLAVQATTSDMPARLLQHLMDIDDAPRPRMPRAENVALLGPVGVLEPRCTMEDARIRPLTAQHPIKPTSPRCHSARRPNPGRGSTYRSGNFVQTTGATSDTPLPFHRRSFLQTLGSLQITGASRAINDPRVPRARAFRVGGSSPGTSYTEQAGQQELAASM